jgi:molybdenum cofactor synthesis domain-containing protein
MTKLFAQVITASNRASKGLYADTSGEILGAGLRELNYEVREVVVVPDEVEKIQSAIKQALKDNINLIVTTGGTGISPTDVTPEATAPLIQKLLPGIAEAMRAYSREKVPTADLSRGIAGVTGNSLIINLPGSPGGVRDGLEIIKRLAPHVHEQLAGQDHSPTN